MGKQVVSPQVRDCAASFQVEGGGGGAKEECVKEIFWEGVGGHACGFLFNFPKVTENAILTIKLLIFFHIFSDVAIGSENSPSLNDCYVILLISTFNYYK